MASTFQARAEQIVEAQRVARAAWRQPNALSGLGLDPPAVETVEAVASKLERQARDREAFRASPRGRFVAVVDELEDLGAYLEEVYRLRGYYTRSISSLNGPHADEHAIACCIRLLNTIGTPEARAGIAALADLLDEQAPARAA